MSFDPTKPVQTRDGRKARALIIDLNNSYPIIAAITEPSGIEFTCAYFSDGRELRHSNSNCDLINIPEKTVRFVNTYPDQGYESLEVAKANSTPERMATVELTYADGKLIDVIVHS